MEHIENIIVIINETPKLGTLKSCLPYLQVVAKQNNLKISSARDFEKATILLHKSITQN